MDFDHGKAENLEIGGRLSNLLADKLDELFLVIRVGDPSRRSAQERHNTQSILDMHPNPIRDPLAQ